MSSHHFVKEGQEPALFILQALSKELAEPLLEWAPVVVVADEALEAVLQWGIKVDVVIASAERTDLLRETLADQGPLRILTYESEGPLLTGLNFLRASHQAAVNIIGDHSHDIMKLTESLTGDMDVSILTTTMRWSAIESRDFRKWLMAGTKLYLNANGNILSVPQELRQLESGQFLTLRDGLVTLRSDRLFWVGEDF